MRDLDLLGEHELEQLLGVPRAHAQRDGRVLRREALQRARQHVGADGRRRADLDAAARAAHEVAHRGGALLEALDRALGIGQQRAPRRRQAHAARQAHEQLGAELGLEALQPRRQARLRHVQLARGRREVAAARDGEEALEPRDARHS